VLELRRHTDDDQALIAAYRAGDDTAFGRIHERHHVALERYARKVLGRSSEHAEDVVQEAMLRASRALRRDDRHIELRPWLYRLTRNCALDELARVRTDSVNFDDAEDWGVVRAPAATEPDAVVESRGKVRDLLGDLAVCRRSSATRCCAGRSTGSPTPRSPTSSASARRRRRTSSTARAPTS